MKGYGVEVRQLPRGKEKEPTRGACKRTAAQLVQDGAPLALYVPCAIARWCGGEWFKGEGGEAGCCAGSERETTRRAC